MIEARWEHGSDPHWIEPTGRATYPWTDRGVLYGNGRFALNAVLEITQVRRLWVPAFFCPEVITAIPNKQLEILTYKDRPGTPLPDLPVRETDALIVQNLWGLRAGPPVVPSGCVVIEDHTHDPISDWAMRSTADYCIASLRKQWPIGDGGVAWSPANRPLPIEPPLDPQHVTAAMNRLTGILLKAAYLDGGAVEKDVFRQHLLAGEAALAQGPISTLLPITRASLPAMPTHEWRRARAANFRAFASALGKLPHAQLLEPDTGAVPFIATLAFDEPGAREHVRKQLIAARIYPAILWALDSATYAIPDEDVQSSRRVLSIHCDHRYTAEDMGKVADVVRRACESL